MTRCAPSSALSQPVVLPCLGYFRHRLIFVPPTMQIHDCAQGNDTKGFVLTDILYL